MYASSYTNVVKGGSSILAGLSIAGLVFSMWFAAASFLVPAVLRFLVPDFFISIVLTGLILSVVYTLIHYKLQGTIFWPILVAGSVAGGVLAYVLLSLVGSSWPLVPWFAGLAVFVSPSVILSVVTVIRNRSKKPVVVEVEPVEPVTPQKPAEQPAPVQEKQVETKPQEPPSTATVQQTMVATVDITTSYPQMLMYKETPAATSIPEKIDSEDVEDYILDFIDQKKITELVPIQSPSADGGVYPVVQNEIEIDTTRLNIVFKRLLERGIIRVGGIEFKRIACPRCFSSTVMFSISCKSCKSANISRQRILQHESCGFLGPEERFVEGGRYMCPRCGTEVSIASETEEETMHDRVKVHSSLFLCYQCNEVNNEPLVSFKCITCGMEFDYNSLELKTFYRYVINPDVLSKALEHNKPVKMISEKITMLGYKVEKNVKVVGASNLTHRADLLISKDGVKKALIMFLKTDRKDEQVNTIMKIMTMKLDLTDLDFYVLSYYPLHSEARRLMELFNIWYVDSVIAKDISSIVSSLFPDSRLTGR